jgi:hypothetical protein
MASFGNPMTTFQNISDIYKGPEDSIGTTLGVLEEGII